MISITQDTSLPSLSSSMLSWLGLSFVLALVYLIYNREGTPLRKVPGPFFASIAQIWIVLQQRKLQRPLLDVNLHRKYGSIVRIGPKEVMVSSPQSRKIIYGAASKFTKGEWYCGVGDCGWSGDDQLDFLPEMNMEKYRLQRRLIGGAYTAGFMREIEPNLDIILEKNVTMMKDRAGMRVDADTFFDYFASDCIQTATFGKSLGFVEHNTECGAIAMVHELWFYMHWIGYFPILHRTRLWYNNVVDPKVQQLLSFLPVLGWSQKNDVAKEISERDRLFGGSIFGWTIKEVDARIEKQRDVSHPNTIADRLFQIQREKPMLTDSWIKEMCLGNFNAGVETIGITISTFLSFIATYPGCQDRIYGEILDARAAGLLSSIPKLKEIESMPYLSACLNESKRLHPPLAHALARVVPEGGIELEGHWLPAGTTVGLNPWVLGRDRTLYGEDADVFRPERWLEFSPQHLKTLDANSMFFGNGARSCPGQYLAEAVYSKAIPLLLMNLEFSFPHPETARNIRATFMTRLDNVTIKWVPRPHISQST